MDSIWMGIAPGRLSTRLLAMHGANETILKARLRRDPMHPRALATLLEAIALWQGAQVRAALAADDEPTLCAASLCRSPLTDLDVTFRAPRRHSFGLLRHGRSLSSHGAPALPQNRLRLAQVAPAAQVDCGPCVDICPGRRVLRDLLNPAPKVE